MPADRPAATMLQAGASMHQVKMSACLWVIWVIWVIVFYCMAMHASRHALGHLGY
jgi:hypothetical protein